MDSPARNLNLAKLMMIDSSVIRHKLQYLILIYKRKIYNSYISIFSFFFTFYMTNFPLLFFSLYHRFTKFPHTCAIVYRPKKYTHDVL